MIWPEKHRIALFLAAAVVVPMAALTWLGIRILRQDRDVERQRQRERLEVAAGRVALDIERRLQDVAQRLARGAGIRLLPAGLTAGPESALLYQPAVRAEEAVGSSLLSDAEGEEFRRQNLRAAVSAYRRLAQSPNPAVRGNALVGLGRVLRRRRDRAAALHAYDELRQLGPMLIAGQPAALIARQGRCRVFEESADAEGLRREVSELARALASGGWAIDRATFELYSEMVERWGAGPIAPDAIHRTEAAIQLWRAWRAGDLSADGRRLLRVGGEPVLAVWTGGPDRPSLWLATVAELGTVLLRPTAQGLDVSLYDIDGRHLLGKRGADAVSLTPGETRLPFILTAASRTMGDESSGARRTVLIGGLAAALLVMLAAAYGLYRTTTREVVLARQQADFVSAVSHEFRTPLTSMRHLTDLLASRSVTSEERKACYYELLARETERLHRMVESLLSFGRIEAGAHGWRLEPVGPDRLVRNVIDEFRGDPLADGRRVVCEIEEGVPEIRADREALSRAVWNLMENAAKYSQPGTAIRVFACRDGDAVLLGVRDEGAGIPAAEREKIFQKFVRGADAQRAGIRGVGIGLALVKRIVEAHGGSVQVESEPGRGSTFTLVLPCSGS